MHDYFVHIKIFFCAAELFTDVQPLVQSALDGYNVSVFAYGQTHSGKTHTMVLPFLSLSLILFTSVTFTYLDKVSGNVMIYQALKKTIVEFGGLVFASVWKGGK